MRINILGYIILGFVIFMCVKIYLESDYVNLKCIISNVDGNTYCVRERNRLELSADRLAMANKNMSDVVKYLEKNFPDKDNVKRLVKGFNPQKIVETLPTSKYTAYSQNKGEKLGFCLDTEKVNGSLIDLNTLTFVALHEISHIATKSIGHTEEFWDNFKFILQIASKINVYKPIDYSKKPQKYCGMKITDNPYFN